MSSPPEDPLREFKKKVDLAAARARPLSGITNPDLTFTQSKEQAEARLNQCKAFESAADDIRISLWDKAELVGGQSTREEDKEYLAGFAQQWHDLLCGKKPETAYEDFDDLASEQVPETAYEVLREDFADLASEQVKRALEVAEAWKQVTKMIEGCKAIKAEVDGQFARAK